MQLDEHEFVGKLDANGLYDGMVERYGATLTPSVEAISRLLREGPARDTGYPGITWVASRQSFTHYPEDRCSDFPDVHLVASAAQINSTLASSAKLLSKGTREQRELFINIIETEETHVDSILGKSNISVRVRAVYLFLKGHCQLYQPAPLEIRKENAKNAVQCFASGYDLYPTTVVTPNDWSDETKWWMLRLGLNRPHAGYILDKLSADRNYSNMRTQAQELCNCNFLQLAKKHALYIRRPDMALNVAECYGVLNKVTYATDCLRDCFMLYPLEDRRWKPPFLSDDLRKIPYLRRALDELKYPPLPKEV
jgi:hypothetical protein